MGKRKTPGGGRPPGGSSAEQRDIPAVARRHLRFGWWSLLVFLTLGLVLEALHGFKIGAYLDPANTTRRLMWTLAHAHGTLLALVNIAFGVTLAVLPTAAPSKRLASGWLLAASLLMPLGFFLGGLVTYGGDPSPGIALAAVGGLMLFVAVLAIARGVRREPAKTRPPRNPTQG